MPPRINQKDVYAHCQDLRYCSIQCRLSSLCIFKCSNIREALPRHQYITVFEHCSKGGRDLKSLSKNVQPKYSKRRGRWVNGILINLKKTHYWLGWHPSLIGALILRRFISKQVICCTRFLLTLGQPISSQWKSQWKVFFRYTTVLFYAQMITVHHESWVILSGISFP